MKKLLFIVILLSCNIVWAQDVVHDSVAADTSRTVGDGKQNRSRKEANILGATVYYDINGNIRGSENPSPYYHRPEHHYLNNLDNSFCSFFAEGKLLYNNYDQAVGLSLSYLPNRWGGYGSLMVGTEYPYFLSAGPVLRLSEYDSSIDWQLYAGFMTNFYSVGAEAGLRMATGQRHSEFCWTSASLGVAVVGSDPFLTFGASFDLIAVLALGTATLLFW